MRDKICIVTGANTGIGKETAIGLAEMGATVVMVCRNRRRGESAAADIRRLTDNPAVELMIADLSSQRQVRQLAADFQIKHSRLDVLVNNAGVITPRRQRTVDGLETQFAVNHLAPFLLTNLLLDVLKASAPSRIVVVASQVESRGKIEFDDLQGERRYDYMAAYCQSKLANVMFTYELARRLDGTGVTANCLHPGVIATNLLSDYMKRPRAIGMVNRLRYPGPSEGAQTSIYLASDPAMEGVSGRYFRCDTGETPSSKASYDEDAWRRLWEVSEQLTGMRQQ